MFLKSTRRCSPSISRCWAECKVSAAGDDAVKKKARKHALQDGKTCNACFLYFARE